MMGGPKPHWLCFGMVDPSVFYLDIRKKQARLASSSFEDGVISYFDRLSLYHNAWTELFEKDHITLSVSQSVGYLQILQQISACMAKLRQQIIIMFLTNLLIESERIKMAIPLILQNTSSNSGMLVDRLELFPKSHIHLRDKFLCIGSVHTLWLTAVDFVADFSTLTIGKTYFQMLMTFTVEHATMQVVDLTKAEIIEDCLTFICASTLPIMAFGLFARTKEMVQDCICIGLAKWTELYVVLLYRMVWDPGGNGLCLLTTDCLQLIH